MSGIGQEDLPMSGNGQETLPDVWEWSGDLPGCPGVFERPSMISESGQEALLISGSGRESLPDVWEWSGGPPGCTGLVGRPSRMIGSDRETIPNVWKDLMDIQEWWESLPDVPEGWVALSDVWPLSGGLPGCPGGVKSPSRCLGVVGKPYGISESGRVALPDVREWSRGPPNVWECLGGPP